MLNTITTILVALLGIQALAKFVFFALPYRKRRAALDKSYGARPSATATSDRVMLVFTIVLAALLLWRGIEAVSFLGGVWIGATLIQLYFHEFRVPVAPERAAPETVSPIKTMSYAIQDSPWRPWPELLTVTVLICWSLILLM
ncbi:MAG: hypothetical protein ABWY20_03025 [Mycobacterium sp.]